MVDLIVAESASEAWIKACNILIEKRKRHGSNLELSNLIVQIRNPLLANQAVHKIYTQHVGREYLKRVNTLLFSTKSLQWKTSYLSRLISWNNEFDQLNAILLRMKKKPGSKTLTCVVMNPPKDLKRVLAIPASMPCITALDFRIRDGRLSMTAYFRSQDVFRVGYPDYIYLGKFLQKIRSSFISNNSLMLGEKPPPGIGEIVCHIVSAFIQCRDADTVRKLF